MALGLGSGLEPSGDFSWTQSLFKTTPPAILPRLERLRKEREAFAQDPEKCPCLVSSLAE